MQCAPARHVRRLLAWHPSHPSCCQTAETWHVYSSTGDDGDNAEQWQIEGLPAVEAIIQMECPNHLRIYNVGEVLKALLAGSAIPSEARWRMHDGRVFAQQQTEPIDHTKAPKLVRQDHTAAWLAGQDSTRAYSAAGFACLNHIMLTVAADLSAALRPEIVQLVTYQLCTAELTGTVLFLRYCRQALRCPSEHILVSTTRRA